MRSLASLDGQRLTLALLLCSVPSGSLSARSPSVSARQLLLGTFGKECIEQECAVIRFGPPARPSAGDGSPHQRISSHARGVHSKPKARRLNQGRRRMQQRKEKRSNNCKQRTKPCRRWLSPVVTCSHSTSRSLFFFQPSPSALLIL